MGIDYTITFCILPNRSQKKISSMCHTFVFVYEKMFPFGVKANPHDHIKKFCERVLPSYYVIYPKTWLYYDRVQDFIGKY